MEIERIVHFKPAYDKRSEEPSEDYGIGAFKIFMAVKGEKGAVSTYFSTDIHLPETIKEYKKKGNKNKDPPIHLRFPEGFKRDYPFLNGGVWMHYPKKPNTYLNKSECDLLDQGYCYFDGSSLWGDRNNLSEKLLRNGEEPIWEYLERVYERELVNGQEVEK